MNSVRSACLSVTIMTMVVATSACAQESSPKGRRVEVSTPQALSERIEGARAGDVIILASGNYGPLAVYRKNLAEPGLAIEAAPGATVTFDSIKIGGAQGITVKGVEVDVKDPQYGVMVGNSSNITLDGLHIHAPTGTAPSAMMLRASNHLVVRDCDIRNVSFGINFLESDHIKIEHNKFADLQVDAIRGSSSYVEVTGNQASSFHPQNGDHPDFIQFWGQSTNAVIKDNVYERGSGDPVQGIFLESTDDVVISGNALLGSLYNAIALSRVNRALVEDNFIQSYDGLGTRIITRGWSSNVTIRNNVATEIVNYKDGGKPNPDYKEENNRSIRNAKVGDTRALEAWLAKRPAS